MTIRTRLQRLEQGIPASTCRACRERKGRIVLLKAHKTESGEIIEDPEPAPCAVCGTVPEQIVVFIIPAEKPIIVENEEKRLADNGN
jgi:hypothetical protein